MTTAMKLWLGFGTLTALLVLSGVIILLRVRSIEAAVLEQSNVALPRGAAARELQVSFVRYALNVRTYLQTDDPRFRAEVRTNAAQVVKHLAEYRRLTRTERQRQLAEEFPQHWQPYSEFAESLMASAERPISQNDSQTLLQRRTATQEFIENELLREVVERENFRRDVNLNHIQGINSLTMMLLIAGVLLAVATSVAVSRGVLQGERTIAEQGERLRTTLASIGDGVIATDLGGRVTQLNPVAEALTGWSSHEAAGLPLEEIFRIVNEDTHQTVENPAAKALREGVIVGLANHTLLIAKDGTERAIDDSAAPIRCKDGEIVGCVLVFRDVSERRKTDRLLQASESRLKADVEAMNRLHRLGTRLLSTTDLRTALDEVLDAAITMSGAAKGNVQLYDAATKTLKIFAQRGFGPEFLKTFESVAVADETACGRAARAGVRTIIENVETDAPYAPFRQIAADSGYAAVQSTPLLNSKGELIGVLSTHFARPHRPAERELRMLDLYARQAIQFLERLQAEESYRENERRLRFVMDSMPQKIVTARPNGEVDYYNPQWFEYTGLTFDEIKDWGWKKFIHPDDLEETVRRWTQAVATGETYVQEHRFRRADGEYRWHLSRTMALRDEAGRIQMWVGSNTDIHEQQQTAFELRKLAAELSESDRRKSEFLAMLAHELRNPLAPIRNAVQVLRLTGENGAGIQPAAEMMERQVSQMVRLVDDLLDISRISRGKIELRRERTELASAIHSAVEANRSLYNSLHQELTVTLPPELIILNADPTRLAQIIGNLLNNACKFTDKGGRIWLTAEVETSSSLNGDGQPAREALIRVRDSGIGLSADQLSHIFEMFVQLDISLERSTSGLGIGLTLVKNLVEMHGGSVAATSDGPGQGSEFIVRLPILTPSAGDVPPPPAPAADLPAISRRILVVDDNRDSAESLAMLLKLTGNDTCTAYDGLQALETAERVRPDVVLLDIGLPKLNGYEACRQLRAQPWSTGMVLVALTGWGQEEDRQKSKEAGFHAHLVKPVDPAALMQLLAELLPAETTTATA